MPDNDTIWVRVCENGIVEPDEMYNHVSYRTSAFIEVVYPPRYMLVPVFLAEIGADDESVVVCC